MNFGIAAYSASHDRYGLTLQRCYAGVTSEFIAHSLDEAADWLTQDYPNSFHVTWRLVDFARSVCSLLSHSDREKLFQSSRLLVGNVKLFYVDRWFGITYTKPLKGNFVEKRETNFFGLEHWLPPEETQTVPTLATQCVQAAKLLETLESMGIVPDRLTSPVGVFSESLGEKPTVWSNPKIQDACEYAEIMMRREWRSAYQIGYFPKAYSYDLRASYPSVIRELPDTDQCSVKFSDVWCKADWAIVRAKVNVTKDYTPIVYDSDDGEHILPLGERFDIFTSEELLWLHQHDAAKIEFMDGFFFKFHGGEPYREPIEKLYDVRLAGDKWVANLAKRISVGIGGKLHQDNTDGRLGDFYNPIYAAMVMSRVRLKVADFIWQGQQSPAIQPIVVQVDGLLTTDFVQLVHVGQGQAMGQWRFEKETPALVLGKGEIWRPDKRPLDLSMDEVVNAMKAKPQSEFYQFGSRYVDLRVMGMNRERVYERFPKNGREALNSVSGSSPLLLSLSGSR